MSTATTKRPKPVTVWMLWGSDYSDRDALLKVFTTQGGAEEMRNRCCQHLARKPEPPDTIEDTPENDELHEKWWNRNLRWQKRHPGGPQAWIYNTFTVVPCKVDPR